MRNFANSKGFNDEEVKQLFDHRSILILMQAMAWEEEQSKAKNLKTKKVKKKVKVVKSGKGIEKSASNKVVRQKKMKRLQQSGHVNDAVGLAEGWIEGTESDVIEAWQYLVDTGLCWKLQGWFGRTATNLIKEGIIHKPIKI